MTHLKHALEQHEGITAVAVNPTAGSVTVRYDPRVYPDGDIFRLLDDLHILVGTLLDAPQFDVPAEGNGHSTIARTFTEAFDDLDKRVAALTGYRVNLRTLVPVSLVGLGVWRSWAQGLGFEMVPGWLLLWLGWDAFVKLRPHVSAPQETETTR